MKLKVSRPSQKKNFFSLPFDNTTTMGFGFVQPLSCTELVPQSTVDLSCASFVRLAPLATPTYGRCNLHHYTCFVPASEVYHPWDSFLSSTSFNGGGSSYIPSVVPHCSLSFLLLNVLLNSACCIFVDNNGSYSRYVPLSSDEIRSAFYWMFSSLDFVAPSDDFSDYYKYAQAIFPTYITYFSLERGDSVESFDEFDFTSRYTGYDGKEYVFAWRYSDFSKNLRSILIGLGYQVSCIHSPVSLLPLFAYYRAYFDLFYPKRFLSYQDSSLYKLIEAIEYSNDTNVDEFPDSHYLSVVAGFFRDLVRCYYTSQSDFVSLHHSGVSTNPLTQSVATLRPNNGLESISADKNEQAALPQSIDSKNIGSVQLRVLRWLTKYINKRTYLGGKIDEILRSQYDSSSECGDSFLIDSFVTPIEISDVMNQAETLEGVLGEYAGKGIGFSSPRSSKYRSKEFGFLIHFACIVPQSGYSQAVDPCLGHVSKFDFYTPGLDGLTLVPTRKMYVYGVSDSYNTRDSSLFTSSFGNIPIYSEYKTKYSLLNGDISLASTRTSYLPYTLDKLLPYINPGSSFGAVDTLMASVVNGTVWRYVGLKRWLGMYDRVFANDGIVAFPSVDDATLLNYLGSSRLDDNFIVHNHFKLSLHAPMLSFGSSFDTGVDDLGSDSEIKSSGE